MINGAIGNDQSVTNHTIDHSLLQAELDAMRNSASVVGHNLYYVLSLVFILDQTTREGLSRSNSAFSMIVCYSEFSHTRQRLVVYMIFMPMLDW